MAEESGLRLLTPSDIAEVLEVQDVALPDTFAALLGRPFNVLYFRALMSQSSFYCLGYHVQGRLAGFITYSPDVPRTLRAAFFAHAPHFVWTLLRGIVARPALLGTVARIARSLMLPPATADAMVTAELMTIALRHEARGAGPIRHAAGASVSHALTTHACNQLAALGAGEVKVLCRPGEPIANKFFQNEGFEPRGVTRRFGVEANLYVRPLVNGAGAG